VTLEFLELSCAKASKRHQKSRWEFYLENTNSISVDDQKTYTGKLISQSLAAELIKIQLIYQPKDNDNAADNMYIPLVNPIMRSNYIGMYFEKIVCFPINLQKENLEIRASDIGEFSAFGIKINIGGLLSIFKSIWPFGSSPNYITGSFQKKDSFVKLVALMEYPSIHAWEIHDDIINEIHISEMIKDLAFKIAYDLAKDEMKNEIQTRNWQSFKWFTNALCLYSEYTKNERAEQLKKVIKALEKAITADTKSPNIWENYGNVLMELNNMEKDRSGTDIGIKRALKAYENALKYTPKESEYVPNILNNLGNALVESYRITDNQSEIEEAIEKYNEALSKTPKNHIYLPNICNNLGNALIESYRITNKEAELEKAIEIFRSNLLLGSISNLMLVSMYTNLGVGLLVKYRKTNKISDLNEAIKSSQRAFELAPNDYPRLCQIVVNMGNMYCEKKNTKAKLECYDKALKINPKCSGAYYNLACHYAVVYTKSKSDDDHKKALHNLEKAIKLDKFYMNFVQKDPDFNVFRVDEDKEYGKLVYKGFAKIEVVH